MTERSASYYKSKMHLVRRFPLFIFFYSTQVLSQNQLDFGKVKADKNFSCNDIVVVQRESGRKNDNSTILKPICQSQNELEIRLFVRHAPSISWDLFVLTYNNGSWIAMKYYYDFERTFRDTSRPIYSAKLRPVYGFDSLFKGLKINNIFTLPNQDELTKEDLVDDGNKYFLTFKAGSKFRRYYFDNPEEYEKAFPKIKEFKNYDNITFIFYTHFQEE